MVNIELSVLAKQEQKKVYKILRNIEEYPKFMRSLKKIEVIERGANRLVTHWEVDIEGTIITWNEENIFDDTQMKMRFKMIEGDYNSYEGEWKIKNAPAGTEISLSASFDWGIPVFEKFVGNVLIMKARTYLKGTLRSLKKKSEESSG
jgi:ribosome-associated toxin RatA of RatAB toxin-antitoxin module